MVVSPRVNNFVLSIVSLVTSSSLIFIPSCSASRSIEVYFLRHGESLFNEDLKAYGEDWVLSHPNLLEDPPLTEKGLHQAKTVVHSALTEYLGSTENEKIGWISSPLTRAVETLVYGMPNTVERANVHLWPVVREKRINSSPDGHGMPWVAPSDGDEEVCPVESLALTKEDGEGKEKKLSTKDLRSRLCSAFVSAFKMKNSTQDENNLRPFPVSKFDFTSSPGEGDRSKMWWLPPGHENDVKFTETAHHLKERVIAFEKQFFDFLLKPENKHLEKVVIGGHSLYWRAFFGQVLSGENVAGGKNVKTGKNVSEYDFNCLKDHSMSNGGVIGMTVNIEDHTPRFVSLNKMNFRFGENCKEPRDISKSLTDSGKDSGNHGMSIGCIIAIIVSCLVGVCILIGMASVLLCRRREVEEVSLSDDSETSSLSD